MLFSSYPFIFLFLPLVVLVYFAALRFAGRGAALGSLIVASLIFYAAWNPVFLWLLLGSAGFNYAISRGLSPGAKHLRARLVLGITVNLLTLAYFKYTAFLLESWNLVAKASVDVPTILLPLAISFFTFQQITYLVDRSKGLVEDHGFGEYVLFVVFFPQLIAGPIVHHREMMSQFVAPVGVNAERLARGFSWFVCGLFKKTVIADTLGMYVAPVFKAVENNDGASLFEAWGAVLGYTVQIYFDFSGYSDMALGIALMLGINLPLNFNSPYKSTSVADYWRRWHMTLGRLLKENLYIPLGGSRCSRSRQYLNLMIVLLLAGLWHGAGWNFVLWGAVHGVFLVVNHAFRTLLVPKVPALAKTRVPYIILTLVCIAIARVLFRTQSMDGAGLMFKSLVGSFGVSVSDNLEGVLGGLAGMGLQFEGTGLLESDAIAWVVVGFMICFVCPNSNEIFGRQESNTRIKWQPNVAWAVYVATLFVVSLLHLHRVSEFIYYRF